MSARPEVRLECGCYGEQRSDGHIRVIASAFLCPERHNCFDWVATEAEHRPTPKTIINGEDSEGQFSDYLMLGDRAVLRPPTPEGGET